MNKGRELAKNTIIFGIGTVGIKLIKFFLIPLYTICMTLDEYSLAEIVMSTVSMVSPILMLGFSNGILRFAVGKKEKWGELLKTAGIVSGLGFLFLLILSPLFNQIVFFEGYGLWIPFLFLTHALNSFLAQLCKGMEKNVTYALDGIIGALSITICSVIFISFMHLGVSGYLLATIVSELVSIIYLSYSCKLISCLYGTKIIKNDIKEIFSYSLPLMPNELSWWIIQMSDRYMVIWICGATINGLYSMAYKIPALFNLIVSMFIQAFGISAIKECENTKNMEGKVDGTFFTEIYRKYVAVTFIMASLIILLVRPFAWLFIKNDFYSSWKYTPLLLCAYAIGNLQAFYGSIYGGIKKSQYVLYSSLAGAICNIICNVILIHMIGVFGAAIATVLSYFVVYSVRVLGIKKYVEMQHFEKKILLSILLILLMSYLYDMAQIWSNICCIGIVLFFIFLYYREVRELLNISIKWISKNGK